MKKIFPFIFILIVSVVSAQNTAPKIEWQKTIGGNLDDKLYSVIQTPDGGYLLGGYSYSGISKDKTEDSHGYGYADYWVVKVNSSGSIQWQNTIGGSLDDSLASAIQTTDGGYLLGGSSTSDNSGDKTEVGEGGSDYWVVKLNSSGEIEWQNTIGGSSNDFLSSVIQTSDGGYMLGGSSISDSSGDKTEMGQGRRDYWVIKLNATGNIKWQNTIGGSSDDNLSSVIQTSDGGYLIGGSSMSDSSGDKTEKKLGGNDYWVVKLNSSGDIEWQNTLGGLSDDDLNSVIQTDDGGYLLGGSSASNASEDKTEHHIGQSDYWVVKLNNSGEIVWENTIGGKSWDILHSVIQTADGGYLLGGVSDSHPDEDKIDDTKGHLDYWLVKLNSSGNVQWQNTIGGNRDDLLQSVIQTADEGFLLGGYSSSDISGDKAEESSHDDFWLVKLTPSCETGWYYADADGDGFGNVAVYSCTALQGYVHNFSDCNDLNASINPLAIEIPDNGIDDNCNGLIDENVSGISHVNDEKFQFSAFPNPSNGNITIQATLQHKESVTIKIFDLAGRELYSENCGTVSGIFSKQIDISNFSDGTYSMEIIFNSNIEVKKLMIQK